MTVGFNYNLIGNNMTIMKQYYNYDEILLSGDSTVYLTFRKAHTTKTLKIHGDFWGKV